jgi:murein DD-endopeptidase MepM/ murein hydrolase activator NlpD
MERRRYLKYAGAGIVVVAGAAGGAYLFHTPSNPTVGYSNTAIQSTSLTSSVVTRDYTASTIDTSSMELSLFADWHGDGQQQADEPSISDVKLTLNGDGDVRTIQVDQEGTVEIEDVTIGKTYHLSFEEDFLSANRYRFISLSRADFRPIEKGIDLVVQSDDRLALGLMVGPLTLPFAKNVVRGEPAYVDLDPSSGIRDWKGGRRTVDNHLGTDYDLPEGTSILAPAPGIIIEAQGDWPNVPTDPNLGYLDDGNRVAINHGHVPPYAGEFYTMYAHLNKVACSVGQTVNRGDKIAESGNTGYKTRGPHLHFQCGGYGQRRVDPYRDLSNPDSLGYWTKDNEPQYAIDGK